MYSVYIIKLYKILNCKNYITKYYTEILCDFAFENQFL